MKLYSGQRLGQSGSELGLAVVLSFFLHILVAAGAVFLVTFVPKKHVPIFYDVALVSQPAERMESAPQKTPQPEKAKKAQKAAKTVRKQKQAAAPKHAMPELRAQKPTPKQETPVEAKQEQKQAQPSASGPVAVSAAQSDFKFAWYLALIREKIGQNWRPPPDTKEAKVRLVFVVNRSGWVENVQLDSGNSSGTFGFQQAGIRAIRSSNPFPGLPEEFPKMSVEFSVDLTVE